VLPANEVVEKARDYLGQVVPEFAALNPKLDEMVFTPEASEWRITFYAHQGDLNPEPKSLADIIRSNKVLKSVVVGAEDGSLIAIRNPF
jgi:hypothetical protein